MTVLPNLRYASVGCFWKDPSLFYMKIQRDTLINCPFSLELAIFGRNGKTALMTTWAYGTAVARNKVVPPHNINMLVQKVLQNLLKWFLGVH